MAYERLLLTSKLWKSAQAETQREDTDLGTQGSER